jgi:hypothetical protein
MADNNNRVTAFGPKTARAIARYVDKNIRVIDDPSNEIGGRKLSQTHTMAKVTGSSTVSGTVQHSWIEVRWNITDKVWENVPEGRVGTTTDSYLINSADAAVELATNTILQIRKCEDPITRITFWVGGSSASLPTGQYQYMAYVMTSNNQAGFDFVRLHPPI